MEYIDGPSLREVIDGQRSGLPIVGAVTILRGILQALSAAHAAGLVHRDVKPANILLREPPADLSEMSEQAVKVTDFGLGHVGDTTTQSILQSGSRLTEEDRSIAGTLAYMSPEQKEGRELDGRSDLFACGIILFEMLTGERPPGGDSPGSLRNDVPPELDDVFRRAYTRRDRRFSSADEMLAALTTRGRGAPPPPPPPILPAGAERCPVCQRDVTRQDQFCIHCGHQLVARVARCAACEAYVRPADRFCIFCGNDLRVLTQ